MFRVRFFPRFALLLMYIPAIGGCAEKVAEIPTPAPVSGKAGVAPSGEEVAGKTEKTNAEPVVERPDNASPVDKKPERSAGENQTVVAIKNVDLKGYKSELAEHRGQVILVDFWGTWCGPCRKGFPHTVEWSRKYAEQGLSVISVSMEFQPAEDRQRALAFLKKQNATFTNLYCSLGAEEEAFEAFDIDGGSLPHYKIYDRKGTLFKKFGGDDDVPIDHSEIETAIRRALGL